MIQMKLGKPIQLKRRTRQHDEVLVVPPSQPWPVVRHVPSVLHVDEAVRGAALEHHHDRKRRVVVVAQVGPDAQLRGREEGRDEQGRGGVLGAYASSQDV